jgi:hypothetical protein
MVNWLLQILNKQSDRKMYGSVTIFFQNGEITHVETKNTEKPPVDLIE